MSKPGYVEICQKISLIIALKPTRKAPSKVIQKEQIKPENDVLTHLRNLCRCKKEE